MKYVVKLEKLELNDAAQHNLSKYSYERMSAYLGSFRPNVFCKAVIADSFEHGVELIREQLRVKDVAIPSSLSNVGLENLMFRVSKSEVIDNRFDLDNFRRVFEDFYIEPSNNDCNRPRFVLD